MAGRNLFAEASQPKGRNLFEDQSAQQSAATAQPVSPAQEEQGFFGGVTEDLAARNKAIQETMAAQRRGDIGSLQGTVQAFGQVAGGGIDVLGQGLSAAGRGISAITPEVIKQPIIETAGEAYDYIAESGIGKSAIDALKGGVEKYSGWKAENPNAAKTLESAVNIAAVVSPLKVGDVLKFSTETAKTLTTPSAKKYLAEAAPTIEGLKSASRGVYKEIDDLGVTLNPGSVTGLSNELGSVAKREGFNRKIHPKVSAALEEFRKVKNRPQTLTEIDTLRKITNSAAKSLEPEEARLGRMLVEKIDDTLDNLKNANFANPSKADIGAKYKDARQLWRRAKKSELLEDAFEKAKNQASGFENGIRTQFRSILNNSKKSKGFLPEELQAMKEVVRGGTAENITKAIGKLGFSEGQSTSMLLGSLGVAGGAAIGGAPGAVAVPLIGQMSKTLAQKLTRNKAAGADLIIRAGKDGKEITKAYLKATKPGERSAAELTELLLRPGIGLEKVKAMLPAATKEQKKIIGDALYFAAFINSQKEDEAEEQQ